MHEIYNYKNIKDLKKLKSSLHNIALENNKEIIIVNIGTNMCIGDSIGPMIGSILEENMIPIKVYGTLAVPIHAMNLEYYIAKIYNEHPDAIIIATDACLGSNKNNIGQIILEDIPLHPGSGVGKQLSYIGEYSIKLVVGTDYLGIQDSNIRLGLILDMAKAISRILIHALSAKKPHKVYLSRVN